MPNVGVIGLGMMGLTHLDVYARRPDVRVVAVADLDAGRRSGKTKAAGNIEGQAKGGIDFGAVKQHADGMDLINDPAVEIVDICLTTPLHLQYGLAALAAGKHVLIEKPLARTSAEAIALADAASKAEGISMVAMCMRFWPAWAWLKDAIDAGTFGKVLAAQFRRVAGHPGGPFYSDGQACGGAALDLHIHDTDFVQYCFGPPKAVSTVGYRSVTSALDHVISQYRYGEGGPTVVAEGGWAMNGAFPFQMQYTVNFERATAVFDLAAKDQLVVYEPGKPARPIEVPGGTGYDHEIAYFLDCVKDGRKPTTVTLESAAMSVAIVEAEVRSADSGRVELIGANR